LLNFKLGDDSGPTLISLSGLTFFFPVAIFSHSHQFGIVFEQSVRNGGQRDSFHCL